jgi:hypothetical protein
LASDHSEALVAELDRLITVAQRARQLFVVHRVRLAALAVAGAVAALIEGGDDASRFLRLIALGPTVIGACIPMASLEAVSDAINRWEQFFDDSLNKAKGRDGKFARYFLTPLHTGSLALWKSSESIRDPHVRAGIRLSALSYFWSFMLLVLVVAAYVIVAVVILIIVLAVISWVATNSGSSRSSYRTTSCKPPVRVPADASEGPQPPGRTVSDADSDSDSDSAAGEELTTRPAPGHSAAGDPSRPLAEPVDPTVSDSDAGPKAAEPPPRESAHASGDGRHVSDDVDRGDETSSDKRSDHN